MKQSFQSSGGRGIKQKNYSNIVSSLNKDALNTTMNMAENEDGVTASNIHLEQTVETSSATNNSEEDTNVSLDAKIRNYEKLIL